MKKKSFPPNNKGIPVYSAKGNMALKYHRANAILAKSRKPRSQDKTDLKLQAEIAIEEEVS